MSDACDCFKYINFVEYNIIILSSKEKHFNRGLCSCIYYLVNSNRALVSNKKIETNRDYVGINNIVHEKNIFWYYGLCTVEKLKIEYKTSNHWIDV